MKLRKFLLPLSAAGTLAAAGLSSSTAHAQAAPCSYSTIWGVVSTNLGDPSVSCNDGDPSGCDLWVYELAFSDTSSCAPFVTALRRVTKTAGQGEIGARLSATPGLGPRGFAYTRYVPGNNDYDRHAVETRGRSDSDFYGFAVTSSTLHAKSPVLDAAGQQVLFTRLLSGGGTQPGSMAAGSLLGTSPFQAQADSGSPVPGKGKSYYLSLPTTSRFLELDQAGKCGTLTETRSVSHDGLVLYSAACKQGGVAQNGKVFLSQPSTSAVIDVSDLVERYAASHRVFQIASPAAADRLDFHSGDFLLDRAVPQPRTRIHVALASHNEEDSNAACAPLETDPWFYRNVRDLSMDLGLVVADTEAAWDLQTDWLFISESKSIDTTDGFSHMHGGFTVLKYLDEVSAPGRISVEAHTHDDAFPTKSSYDHNYGDLAGWFDSISLAQKTVAGGFNFSTDVTDLSTPVSAVNMFSLDGGVTYYRPSWQAGILTFASLGNHEDGSDVRLSGIWRPLDDGVRADSTSGFFRDSTHSLVHVGTGTRGYLGVLQLLDDYDDLPRNIYPAHIFFPQCEISVSKIAALRSQILDLRPYVIEGEVVWETVPDMVADWVSDFHQAPSCQDPGDSDATYDCEFF